MLLDSVERYDKHKIIKTLCIESLINEKRLPPQIHSVPALLIVNENIFLYGKQVFDYLLLPGAGKLVLQPEDPKTNISNNNNTKPDNLNTSENNNSSHDEPLGFSISLNGMSDGFSLIEDIEADLSNLGNNDRQYNWTPIDTANIQPSEQSFADINQDARSRKDLPSLALLQEQRALDLNKPEVINPNSMPNAISSR
jgi:hypothetical protein